jgi:hypothetical protein
MLQLLRPHVGHARKGHRLTNPDNVQHINLKVFIADPAAFELAAAIPVFHRWIRDGACPEMLIDVADYAHVSAGPGVLLIGHEANYSFDNRENRLGLLYNRKAALDGTFQSRLGQAYKAALDACDRLEREPELEGRLKFDRKALEVFVNDRLLAPNTEETWQALRPELEKFFEGARIERHGEPRDLFRVMVGCS